jgi:hypothetical protein
MQTVTRKKCKAQLEAYDSPEGISPMPYMVGLKGTKKRSIYLSHKGMKFETKETQVPPKWRKLRSIGNVTHNYHCKPFIPKLKGLEWWQWVKRVAPKGLTIADIQRLKPGDKLKIILLDRNFGDTLDATIKDNKIYPAVKALRNSHATYVHEKGLQGTLEIPTVEGEGPVPFEFHLEYAPDRWFPLVSGVLPPLLGKPSRKWTDFPTKTHVGYRGPMLLDSIVPSLPPFYTYSEY